MILAVIDKGTALVISSFLTGAAAVAAAVIGVLANHNAGVAKKNTQPDGNGGHGPHDVLVKGTDYVIQGQEYTIGLIHGLTGEMRQGFKEVNDKADEAARLAKVAADGVLGQTEKLDAHLDDSATYGAAIVAEGTKILDRLDRLEGKEPG